MIFHTVPDLEPEAFVRVVHAACPPTSRVFLTSGGFVGPIGRARIGAFVIEAPTTAPRLLADAWLPRDRLDVVRTVLCAADLPHRETRLGIPLGGWDVMWATSWRYAWVTDVDAFSLWGRRTGRIAHVQGATMTVHGEVFESRRVREVDAYASDDFFKHGVALRLDDGRQVEVAHKTEWVARVDPTYDGLNVLADMSWAVELARALVSMLTVDNPEVEARDTFTGSSLR